MHATTASPHPTRARAARKNAFYLHQIYPAQVVRARMGMACRVTTRSQLGEMGLSARVGIDLGTIDKGPDRPAEYV